MGNVNTLSPKEKEQLVDKLLAVKTMRNRNSRNQVVQELSFADTIDRDSHAANKEDVINIVNRCLDFPDGLQQLIERIEYREENSQPVQNLRKFLQILFSSPQPFIMEAPHILAGRRDFYSYVPLPLKYVPRKSLLSEVRDKILTGAKPMALTSALERHVHLSAQVTALHGMGGVGKSVMARALCDDDRVQAAFPDGILWATLGKDVTDQDIFTKLRQWIERLGGTVSENVPTIESLKVNLGTLLEGRACLLIVDDVWTRRHIEMFRVGGPRCQLVITTRDAEIARELGITVFPIPMMTKDEAITLLTEWSEGVLDNTDKAMKEKIVDRLGCLALAIKLAGTQLRSKSPLDWLANFSVRKLKSKRPEGDIHDSLEQTFGISLDELPSAERRAYAALAIFREDEVVLEVGIERLWNGLAGWMPDQTHERVDDLAARALLDVAQNVHPRTVVLHDLLRDFMSSELGAGRHEAHLVLLQTYRATRTGAGWYTAPDDGYLYNHLAYHLEAVGAYEELRALFLNHEWLHVRVPQSSYEYDAYLGDLMSARKFAEMRIADDEHAVVDCVRYALIRTSVNSISSNYAPSVVARALEIGLWKPHRALSVAAKITLATFSDPIGLCVAILKTEKLSDEERFVCGTIGVEAALQGKNTEYVVKSLASLVAYLSGEQKKQVLQRALQITLHAQREGDRALGLTLLIEHLAHENRAEQLPLVLNAALELKEEHNRVKALAALIPHLTSEQRVQILGTAKEIEDTRNRITTILALLPYLSQEQHTEAVQEALAALVSLLVPEGKLESTSSGVLQVSSMPDDDNITADIGLRIFCATSLAGLAPHVSDAQRAAILDRVLLISLTLPEVYRDSWDYVHGPRSEALRGIIPHFTGSLLERALAAVMAFEGGWPKSEAIEILAPRLTTDLVHRTLDQITAEDPGIDRLQCMITLVAQLPEAEKQARIQAIYPETIGTVGYRWSRVKVLIQLVPHMQGERRREALERILDDLGEIKIPWLMKNELSAIAPWLEGELLQRALDLALYIDDESWGACTLAKLAECLTGEYKSNAVEYSLKIALEAHHTDTIACLLQYLPVERRKEVLSETLDYALTLPETDPGSSFTPRAEALAELGPHLEGEFLERAVEAALAMSEERHALRSNPRLRALTGLAPSLTGILLDRVLHIALGLGKEGDRADLLISLAPRLSSSQLQMALDAAYQIPEVTDYGYSDRADLLTAIASRLMGPERHKIVEQCLDIIERSLSDTYIGHAIERLVPVLPDDLVEQAVQVASKIQDDSDRIGALVALIPRLGDEEKLNVVKACLDTTLKRDGLALNRFSRLLNANPRLKALGRLAPHLTGELWQQALDGAVALPEDEMSELEHSNTRVETLVQFLPNAPDPARVLGLTRRAVADFLADIEVEKRKSILGYRSTDKVLKPPILSANATNLVSAQMIEICRDWRWI